MLKEKRIHFGRIDKAIFISAIVFTCLGYCVQALKHTGPASVLLLIGFVLPVIGLIGFQKIRTKIFPNLSSKFLRKNYPEIGAFAFCVIGSVTIYFMTVAPSASLWDCSEFIAGAYKLQVPHPPGAPLFLIVGKVFSFFAFNDATRVAFAINAVSVISSGLAVGFSFLIAYMLLKQMVKRSLAIIGAVSAAMTMAFLDTFWFSAVEAEVYAMASCYCLMLFFIALYLKENDLDREPRFLALLAYLFGLGYCIHPMCLLIIPVIACVYLPFIARYGFKGWVLSFALGGGLLLICNRLLSEGLFQLAYRLDIFLVNNFSLPFYSSVMVLLLMMILLGLVIDNCAKNFTTVFWMVVLYVFGLSPNLVLFVGSANDPAMDQHNPENLQTISSYMVRASYGTRPLFYGQYYDASIIDVEAGEQEYLKKKEGYSPNGFSPKYAYESSRQTILPRMYSADANHVKVYEQWAGLKKGEKPLFRHNLQYFISYQLGHMFFRYFAWNFMGREGDYMHASWLKPWANDSGLEDDFQNRKAQNQYWFIPLIIGLIGVWYNYKHSRKAFWQILSLFLITGPILAFYLNSPPVEPRERDYIYVVSFMTYCLWIGFGVVAIGKYCVSSINKENAVLKITIGLAMGVPLLLLVENFDDHDRSHQTIHLEHARMVLESCEPDAILFTGGDNDTFPLWYLQQVEEVRTDVRVIVLSYFNSDWCMQQSKDWQLDSPPLPITLSEEQLRSNGPNDVVFLNGKSTVNTKKLMGLINQGHEGLRMPASLGTYYHQVPGNQFSLAGDKPERHSENLHSYLKEKIIIKAKASKIYKSDLAFLDITAHNNWERPIYFNMSSLNGLNLDINSHVIKEGLLYRFLPVDTKEQVMDRHKNYNLLVNRDAFTQLTNNHHLSSEDHIMRIIEPLKASYNELIYEFIKHNEFELAEETIQYALDHFYPNHLDPGVYSINLARLMYQVGMEAPANELLQRSVEIASALKRQRLEPGMTPYHNYVLQHAKLLLEEYDEG